MFALYTQFVELLDNHNVREPVMELLLWEKPKRSALFVSAGLMCFFLVHILGIGMLTVVGTLAILQLFLYRTCEALQNKDLLIKRDINLRETIVLTPDASTISTSIEIVGDFLRMLEEFIKEVSLTSDYKQLLAGVVTLTILSIVGRLISLPTLLLLFQLNAFTVPWFYLKHQETVDSTWSKVMSKLSKKTKDE